MPPTTASSAGSGPAAARPFREGLLALDPPRLLGSRCGACGTTTFPPRGFCPACRAAEGLQRVELAAKGRVHSYTVVRQALAWVDLPSDQVRLMSKVVGIAPEEVVLDLPVELELAPFGTADDGADLMGYRFRAAEVA